MKVFVGLKPDDLLNLCEKEEFPDYANMFNKESGVTLIAVHFGGLYASYDMPEEAYRKLAEEYKDQFCFGPQQALDI